MSEMGQLTDDEARSVIERHGVFGILECSRDGRISSERAIVAVEAWERDRPFRVRVGAFLGRLFSLAGPPDL